VRATAPGIYQIIGIASLTGRSKSTGDATYPARLKTGAGQFKRLAESWGAPSSSPHRAHSQLPLKLSCGVTR
jgi:hypothetical protein